MAKVVILAGGFGTRISEVSHLKPKPMVEIGGMPVLWHIMKTYSHYGFNEFIICAGYKSYVIKDFFNNYYLHSSDVTFDFANKKKIYTNDEDVEQWKVTVVNTGQNTMTGGRIKRIKKYIGDDEYFLATYGDGVSNIDIKKLVEFHKSHSKIATISTVMPTGRYGVLDMDYEGCVNEFNEKPKTENSWINAGFFVFNKEIFDYIEDDSSILERAPFNELTKDKQLTGFKHHGFWQSMDTLRDNKFLNDLWEQGEAKWKIWN